MAYLLDANVFISAHRLYYGMNLCPGFWDALAALHDAGNVLSIASVYEELTDRDDEVSVWAAERGEAFFRPVQASDAPALGQIAEWVNAQSRFTAAAKTEFLQIADYYLVAQALAGRHTVVTLELPAPASQKTVKIPDVCIAHAIKYTSPFRMLRDAGIQFVLPPPPATEPTLFDPAD